MEMGAGAGTAKHFENHKSIKERTGPNVHWRHSLVLKWLVIMFMGLLSQIISRSTPLGLPGSHPLGGSLCLPLSPLDTPPNTSRCSSP